MKISLRIALAVVSLAACKREAPSHSSLVPVAKAYTGDSLPAVQGEPRAGGTLRVGITAEPPSLNPQLDPVDAKARDIAYYVFESLAQNDPRTFQPEPRLAERWELSDDHLTFTFYLRHDVRWHDGTPFTADDVVFTFDTLRDPKIAATGVRSYVAPVTRVEAVDTHTVRFTVKEPNYFSFDAITDIFIYPKHVYAKGDFNTHAANRAPVGTGRYRFSAWKTGDSITLTRNDAYYGRKAYLDTLVFVYAPDPAMRAQMARNGELDVVERLSPEQWQDVTGDDAITDKFYRLRHIPDGVQWVGWNQAKPMFADKRVRRALTMLIDRRDIAQNLRLGLDTAAASWFYPGSPEHDPTLAVLPYDPKAAAALLEEAGWVDSNHDGTRDKDGRAMVFTFLYPTNNPLYEQLASLLVSEMGRVNIRVETAKLEWAVYTERLRKRDFDACSLVWKLDPEGDPTSIWHSSSIEQGSNWVGFANAEADKLLVAARREFDRNARAALYRRFSAVLYDEQPTTLLFNRYNLSLVAKKFDGVYSTPYGLFRYDDFYVRAQ